MPNWSEVLYEITQEITKAPNPAVAQGAVDRVRRRYVAQLFAYTQRNTIAYYSGFLAKAA